MRKPMLLSVVILFLATILSGCFYYAYDDDWGPRHYRGDRDFRDSRGYYDGRRNFDGPRDGYRGYR